MIILDRSGSFAVIRGLDPRISEMAGSSPAMTVGKAIQRGGILL
jgi:hypothetical protein